MKHKKQRRRKERSGISKISPNTSVDNKLTYASLLLGYMFEYGVDLKRRIINITGEIDEQWFDLVDLALTEMEAESRAAITIKINSQGGDTYQATAIVGRIRESKCKIVTKGYGQIMSAAALILASGDKRMVSEHAWFMYHEASYELPHDRHSLHKDYVMQAEHENMQWAVLMSSFSKENAEFWLSIGERKDKYFTPAELEELGVVDEIF